MNPRNSRTIFRTIIALATALGLSACASVDTTSRNARIPAQLSAVPEATQAQPGLSNINVAQITVNVPQSLRVSEANRYYPSGDIVWREDPIGNRHAQVKTIIEAGLNKGTSQLTGERPVVIQVMVTRFHALTEKARYTVGGVHAIQFYMSVIDAQSGAVLMPAKLIKADFDALGGAAAVASEARGVTQKVRITDQLARVIVEELGGQTHVVVANPVMEAINRL